MKALKLCTLFTALLGTSVWAEALGPYERSLASESEYTHAITPSIGLDQGQLVISGDYEMKVTEHFGFGGTLYFTPEDEPDYAQMLHVGVDAKIHAPLGDIDFFARPGVGIAFVEYTKSGSGEDALIFSPIFGIGALYRVGANIAIGAEYLTLFNWTEDDLPSTRSNFLVATQIRF
jgi:hypothetical protein